MRIKVLDEYTIGNSALAHDDIIIGDSCGRWVPLDHEGLPEIIAALTQFVHFTQETVSPSEFERRGKELDGDETLEYLYDHTTIIRGELCWDETKLPTSFPFELQQDLIHLHEERK